MYLRYISLLYEFITYLMRLDETSAMKIDFIDIFILVDTTITNIGI